MKDIMLKIVGKQIVRNEGKESEEEIMELMTEGKFYNKGDSSYIIYDESEFSGMEGCTTSLKITGDNIHMRRYGDGMPIDTMMKFEPGERYEGMYETPYGAMEMELLTNSVYNNINTIDGTGSIDIDYNICLRGFTDSRSKLNIQIL